MKRLIIAAASWEVIFWLLTYLLLFGLGLIGAADKAEKLIFKEPAVVYLVLLIVPLFILFYIKAKRANVLYSRAGAAAISYLPVISTSQLFIRYFLIRNALVFLIFTMAMPAYGVKKTAGTVESMELAVCLDISNSMNTKDISPADSRLEISKRALIQLINNLNGEKIGLCLFANDAFIQLPLTTDYTAAKMFINDIETNLIASQGTDISEAFKQGKRMFSDEKVSKGLLLITDGENHEGNLDEAIDELNEDKIQVIPMGIGTTKGGLVPQDPSRPEVGYKSDAKGRAVLSKLNKSLIKEIASKTGGKANFTSEEFPDLSPLLTQLNQLKRSKIDNLEFDVKQEKYRIPLTVSLCMWILYFIWSRKSLTFVNNLVDKQ